MSVRLGWIEKAMMLVPGYRGYKRRELLREDDRLIRKYVADVLREAAMVLRRAMNELSQRYGSNLIMVTQVPNNPIEVLENASRRIEALATRVEHLEMGYSPSFDRLKVKEDELRRLLEIDNSMIGYANVLLETARQIAGQIRQSGWFDTRLIVTVLQSLEEIERIIEERRRFLHGSEPVRSGELGV